MDITTSKPRRLAVAAGVGFVAAVVIAAVVQVWYTQPAPPVPVTAFDLAGAYEEDAGAADAKYLGKRLAVKGAVASVNVLGSRAFVELVYTPEKPGVLCSFDPAGVAGLAPSEVVTVGGVCRGWSHGGVLLEECRLVDRRPAPTVPSRDRGPGKPKSRDRG